MDNAALPPKPYESYLADMLTAAMKEGAPNLRSVDVSGRSCVVEYDDETIRYLLPDDVLTRALAASLDSDAHVGEVTLLPYDDAAATEPFHDGMTWVGGPPAHWCLDPDNCPDAPTSDDVGGSAS